MGQEYLIDSNAIIDFFNGSMPESGRKFLSGIEPKISVINQIEIFSSNLISKQELYQLQQFVNISKIYEVTTDVAAETIKLRSVYKIKLPDAIIAATAIYYNLMLVTRNSIDFDKIDKLTIINPYNI